ncbi:MAG: phospholipase D-like domain-containing protein, partial [Actinomycetota bacterium]|nr:phospholipase D-like domain-containing protein [Actinomycetota bacterium]
MEQDAPDQLSNDPAIAAWFLGEGDRANPATDLRAFTTGNLVEPLIDGHTYFARLRAELAAAEPGDQVYFLDFRGDLDERLDGPGSEVGTVLGLAAQRKVLVFGMLWRSQPKLLKQSEEANAEFVRELDDAGGQVLLDGRTRRAGSHHQKLVILRHPAAPARDLAFVGGIDLGFSRNDDSEHAGDPQVMDFPEAYGERPPWHDIQAAVHGPAVHDLEHTFRERWYGSSVLDLPSPVRQLYDRAYHIGAMTSRPLPDPAPDNRAPRGPHAVQVLRTYPARLRRYPFAPHGERSIAHAYRKAFARARRLVYLEDQYLWSRPVARMIASALRQHPGLYVIAVVPRFPDHDGTVTGMPGLVARHDLMRACAAAGGDRFAVYDLENRAGTPVYVHAKVVVADDVWAMVGSDNLNRRSWSHDSELSIAVLDAERDARAPLDPGGLGDGARTFARDLRLRLWREHLDRTYDDLANLLDPGEAFAAFRR